MAMTRRGFLRGRQVGRLVIPDIAKERPVRLRVSQDGGRTWGNERQASIVRLGRETVIEVTPSDPVPCRILNAWVHSA